MDNKEIREGHFLCTSAKCSLGTRDHQSVTMVRQLGLRWSHKKDPEILFHNFSTKEILWFFSRAKWTYSKISCRIWAETEDYDEIKAFYVTEHATVSLTWRDWSVSKSWSSIMIECSKIFDVKPFLPSCSILFVICYHRSMWEFLKFFIHSGKSNLSHSKKTPVNTKMTTQTEWNRNWPWFTTKNYG